MPPKVPSKKELAIYHQAGYVVAAFNFDVKVLHIEIDIHDQVLTKIAPLEEHCNLDTPCSKRTVSKIESYVSAILGGSIGRLLRAEQEQGYKTRCYSQYYLERKCLANVKRCLIAGAESAFFTTIAWLSDVDEGHAPTTIERLWQRANYILRKDQNRERLRLIAERLKQGIEMSGEEVVKVIRSGF